MLSNTTDPFLRTWLEVIEAAPDKPIEWIHFRVARIEQQHTLLGVAEDDPPAARDLPSTRVDEWVGLTWVAMRVNAAERRAVLESGIGTVRRTLKLAAAQAWTGPLGKRISPMIQHLRLIGEAQHERPILPDAVVIGGRSFNAKAAMMLATRGSAAAVVDVGGVPTLCVLDDEGFACGVLAERRNRARVA